MIEHDSSNIVISKNQFGREGKKGENTCMNKKKINKDRDRKSKRERERREISYKENVGIEKTNCTFRENRLTVTNSKTERAILAYVNEETDKI